LGYFRGQETKELRFFIDLYTHPLPGDFYQPQGFLKCQPEMTCLLGVPAVGLNTYQGDCISASALSDQAMIVSIILDAARLPAAYMFVSSDCGDCRAKGGTTTKPVFWQ